MTKILVICGAGASSSFLVHAMRSRAANRGLDLQITAGALDGLPLQIDAADAVLVGSHLAESFADVAAAASAGSATAILLPPVTFDATGADIALDLLIENTAENTAENITEYRTESTRHA